MIAVLEQLLEPAQKQLVDAMNRIQSLLGDTPVGYVQKGDPFPSAIWAWW